MARYRIAAIPGDGIAKEVVPEGIRVLDAVGTRFGISFEYGQFDWSCETYKATGRFMPPDGFDPLRAYDSIFLGAVGFPGVSDPVPLWCLLLLIRLDSAQFVNIPPVQRACG